MLPSSRQIRVMPQQIHPVETRHEHGEVKRVRGQNRTLNRISGLRSIPKKTAIMVWSGNFKLQQHHFMTVRLICQKKVKWYTGTRDISALNLSRSMQPWNGMCGIIPLASGIYSETSESQENDLPAKDLTPLSRPFSNRLIPWLQLLQGYMRKWSLLRWVSTSVVSGHLNISRLSSGCYGIS